MTNQRVRAIIGQMTRAEIEEMMKVKEKEELVLSKHNNSIWFQESRNIYLTRIQKGGKKQQIQAKTYEEMIDRLYDYYELDGTNLMTLLQRSDELFGHKKPDFRVIPARQRFHTA